MTMTTIESVKKSVTVRAPQAKAFEVFTARFGDWWPLETHHTGDLDVETVVIEPRAGGRWFERATDGTEALWGYVSEWAPPALLVLAWHLNADFAFDPDPAKASEVAVTFTSVDDATTRVELEHRKLEVFGDRADQTRVALDGDGGWGAIIEEFARLVG